MQEEIWKDIPEYEGKYQVSNLGRVKSLSRVILKQGLYPSITKEIILKHHINTSGYYKINLNSPIKTIYVHKLVALAFLNHNPNINNFVIDHINNNKLDNRVENLQIISIRENLSKDKKNKTSKYTGVTKIKNSYKWRANISINGKRIHLGVFVNELEAYIAYKNKVNEINKI